MDKKEAEEMERSFNEYANSGDVNGLDILDKIMQFVIRASKNGTVDKTVELRIKKPKKDGDEILRIVIKGIREHLETVFVNAGTISVNSEQIPYEEKILITIMFKKVNKVFARSVSLN